MAWSGSGWWVAICNLLGGALGFGAAWLLHAPDRVAGAVFFAVWGALSGIAIFFVTKSVESQPPRRLIDVATNETIEIPAGGAFSGLPMGARAFINPIGSLIIAGIIYAGYWNPLTALR